jgi:carbonic anhydrase/acetyltransferase-like protein (isoleucine patch superfamily)
LFGWFFFVFSFVSKKDGTIVTEALGPLDDVHDGSCIIGHYVTVGHNCVLRATTIEPECLVGMGSTLDEGSYMEKQSILGAGSYLGPGQKVLSGELWAGNPAKKIRDITEEERAVRRNRKCVVFCF